MPPTQTTHCVPKRSSKLMPGAATAAGAVGGGATGADAAIAGSGSLGAAGSGAMGEEAGAVSGVAVGCAVGAFASAVGASAAPARGRRGRAAPPRSIAASLVSTRRNCSPSPTDFTSATMAMIGNASTNSASTTKNRSMKITSLNVTILTKRLAERKRDDAPGRGPLATP